MDKLKLNLHRSTSVQLEINKKLKAAHPIDRYNISTLVKRTKNKMSPDE